MNLDEIISEMNLGGKIKYTRERKEILPSELAEFAGVSEDSIAEIENNERLPDYDTVLLIKELLDLNMDLTWLKIIDYLGVIWIEYLVYEIEVLNKKWRNTIWK